MSENVGPAAYSRSNIVEQILEQGQRLRNAMVKSILDNDPFYVDVVDRNTFNNAHTQKGKRSELFSNKEIIVEEKVSSGRKQKPTAVLRDDWDDSSPVGTTPTMSTEFFDFYCGCEICIMYRNQNTWARRHLPSYNHLKQHSVPLPNTLGTEKLHTFSGPTLSSYDSEDSTNFKVPGEITRINLSRQNSSNPNLKKAIAQDAFASGSTHTQREQKKSATIEVQSQTENLSEEITKSIQDNYRSKTAEYFKYVNSLKITIHSLTLNQAGNRKVSISSVDSKYKLPTSFSHSYFIEYSVPDCLVNIQPKTKSKVDSGLTANLFRICSKKLQNEEVYFKHTSVHDIISLLQVNLQDIDIKFQVSSRTMKQKRSNVLGYATFNMSLFEVTKHLCCTQNFPIVNEDFTLGTLKMTLQLGCGRMYFGKEFVEFVINNKNLEPATTTERSDDDIIAQNTAPSSQPAGSIIYVDKTSTDYSNKVANRMSSNFSSKPYGKSLVELSSEKPSPSVTTYQHEVSRPASMKSSLKQVSLEDKPKSYGIESSIDTNRSDVQSSIKENTNFHKRYQNTAISDMDNKSLLYGLIYVSEAQYFENPINSYLSCQAFCQGDTLCSRVVYNTKDPVFNFYQKVPFLFDDSFLLCMRDSCITVDFWERYDDEDIAIGTSQLSLHQFFIAYRNKVIAETLLQNRLPVTISDWWEPICSPVNGRIYGQMKVLVAVGTSTQIFNLEVERGLKDNSLTVTYIPIIPEVRSVKKRQLDVNSTNTDRSTSSFKRPDYLNKNIKAIKENIAPGSTLGSTNKSKLAKNEPLKVKVREVKKVDVGVQSDLNMESQLNQNKVEPSPNNSKTENMLEAFLTQLIEQKSKNIYVENATNTENMDIHNNLSKNLNNEKLGTTVSHSLNKLSQCKNATNMQLRKTSDLLDYLNEALTVDGKAVHSQLGHSMASLEDENSFKAHVVVEGALHLPCKRKCKSRKTRRKNIPCEEVLPSTYVTFETIPGAQLKVGPVVQRSASPQWDFRCDVLLPGEILTNTQKRLIFKVWRKNNGTSLEPNLQTDVVLGFAALDLTVLLAGLPSVQGWFNIVDFSSKCNGQMKVHVTPLENISRFSESNTESLETVAASSPASNFSNKQSLRATLEIKEEPTELLNRALKRKFTELEEITQRLRSRLADVTKDDSDTSNDEFVDEFERDINTLCVEEDYNLLDLAGDWTPRPFSGSENGANNYLLKEVANDEISSLGQFTLAEPSIYSKAAFANEPLPKLVATDSAYGSTRLSENTEKVSRPCVSHNFSSSTSNELSESGSQLLPIHSPNRVLTPADNQLIAGRQRIDTLLEKLTLLSGTDVDNAFSSRYVSGCSMNQEMPVHSDDRFTKESGSKAGSSFNIDAILNPALFNQLCSFDVNSTGSLTEPSEGLDSSSNAQIDNGSSSNSLLTQFSTYRQAPDGAGNNNADCGISNKKQNV